MSYRQADLLILDAKPPQTVLGLYEELIRSYPHSSHLNRALFNSGMLYFEQGRTDLARERFQAYVENFPDGGRAETALFMLEKLRKERKKPENRPEPVVRVMLEEVSVVELRLPKGGHLLFQEGGYESTSATTLEFGVTKGGITWKGRSFGGALTVLPEGGGFTWEGQYYPGEAALVLRGGKILCVNRLPMEIYLPRSGARGDAPILCPGGTQGPGRGLQNIRLRHA